MHWIYIFITVAIADPLNKISWTVKDLPFVIGENVTLFCNTSNVGLQKTTWIKQSDVIVHFGFSFYPDKYTAKKITDGSTLTIMNATVTDFNTSYTCLSDEYSYEAVLNSSNIIYLPQRTVITGTVIERNVFIQMNLDRCFPVPECITMFHDDILITEQQESSYLENGFFYITINMTSQSPAELCGDDLTVVCTFRGSYSQKFSTHFLQDCKGSEHFEYRFGFIGTIVGVFAPVIILCGIYCSIFLYKYNLEKEKEKETSEGKYLIL